MRITAKGQVTIPQAIRERAGLLPGTEVEFRLDEEGVVRLVRPKTAGTAAKAAVAGLWGQASAPLSTEDIMALTRDWRPEEPGAA